MADKPTADAPIAPTPAPVAKIVPAAPKVVDERYFKVGSFRQNTWFVDVRRHLAFEDVLKREFWSHVTGRLRTGDKIAVIREDGGFYGELIVFAVGINWAEVRVLVGPIAGSSIHAGSRAADDFEIKDMGTIQHWVVIRKSDGAFVKNDSTRSH